MRLLHDVEPAHLRPAPVRPQQGGENADGRGLPRAVGAQHSEQPPLRHLEIDPVERPGLAVVLRQAVCLDRVSHGFVSLIVDTITLRYATDSSLSVAISR